MPLAFAAALALAAGARAEEPPPAPEAPGSRAAEPADPAAPTVAASLDRTLAHVGDRLTLTVTAVARADVARTARASANDLGRFEVLDDTTADSDLGDGRVSRRFTFQIAAYETGDLEVPAIPVSYVSAAGVARTVKTQPIAMRLQPTVDDPKAEMQPLAKPRDVMIEDRRFTDGLFALGAGVALLLAALMVRGVLRRRGRRPAIEHVEPARPAHEVALARLAELRARGRFDDDGSRPFHFALSEVLRGYVGSRYGFDSLELTTTELLDELSQLARLGTPAAAPPPVDAELEARVAALLGACDLVKFAKAGSTDAAARALLDEAEALVRRTIPTAPAPSSAPTTTPTPPTGDTGATTPRDGAETEGAVRG